MRRLRLVVLGGALLVASATWNAGHDVRAPLHGEELTYFPSGQMLHAAAVGFDGLVADLTFLRAVQYYGEHRQSDRRYPWTRHLFRVVTELDPRFITPYLFGALVLADDVGRLDLALDLIERGMEENPQRWELPFEAGFLIFVHHKNPTASAKWFRLAMTLPGAPPYVRRFAACSLTRAGSREPAIQLWREIERDARDPAIREAARRYIAELERSEGVNGSNG